jgi:N-acetylglucosamine PTS system EIICBA or EIICB component
MMAAANRVIERVQPLGRALMLPIAVLPIAALLLRLGQPDMLDIAFVAAAGNAIFANLGLLFAVGVAVGLARENHGAAGLAGVVCFLVATEGAKALLTVPPDAIAAGADQTAKDLMAAAWQAKEISKLSVPAGIISGLVAGALYNRYATIKLPSYLGFFAGRRFVPIAAGLVGIVLAALFGPGFPWFEGAIDGLSHWIVAAGPIGLFCYGLLNRLLLVTGLHHILNNIAWFIVGDFHGTTGDLKRFFAGDPSAGGLMAGFFPVMMFGLPAACLAMYRAAKPEQRAGVAGLYLSLALTSFLTGVTEPIEFTFLFLAPLLFLVHAILTGLAMMIMALLGVKLGFGFSAGLLDYGLNYGLATRPLLLIPVGLVYALIYYATFSWCIRRFNLKVPGRDDATTAPVAEAIGGERPEQFIAALGGRTNLTTIDACTTRLRLVVADTNAINEAALKALGARGVLKLSANAVQVVVGPEADSLASEMRAAAARGLITGSTSLEAALSACEVERSEALGRRLLITCAHPERADEGALKAAGARTIAHVPGGLHLLFAGPAPQL